MKHPSATPSQKRRPARVPFFPHWSKMRDKFEENEAAEPEVKPDPPKSPSPNTLSSFREANQKMKSLVVRQTRKAIPKSRAEQPITLLLFDADIALVQEGQVVMLKRSAVEDLRRALRKTQKPLCGWSRK